MWGGMSHLGHTGLHSRPINGVQPSRHNIHLVEFQNHSDFTFPGGPEGVWRWQSLWCAHSGRGIQGWARSPRSSSLPEEGWG